MVVSHCVFAVGKGFGASAKGFGAFANGFASLEDSGDDRTRSGSGVYAKDSASLEDSAFEEDYAFGKGSAFGKDCAFAEHSWHEAQIVGVQELPLWQAQVGHRTRGPLPTLLLEVEPAALELGLPPADPAPPTMQPVQPTLPSAAPHLAVVAWQNC